jgi:hypothetical protein
MISADDIVKVVQRWDGLFAVGVCNLTHCLCHDVENARSRASDLKLAVNLAIPAIRENALREALTDNPVSEERLKKIRETAAEWSFAGPSEQMVQDLLALIDHLRAQVAWMAREQDRPAVQPPLG